MSRSIEQSVADVINASISGLVEVRTAENADAIPESSMITVHLESQQLVNASITNLFENNIRVALQMHHADKTESEMDTAGSAVLNALTDVNLPTNLQAYHTQLKDTRSEVSDGYWIREYNITVLAVDTGS